MFPSPALRYDAMSNRQHDVKVQSGISSSGILARVSVAAAAMLGFAVVAVLAKDAALAQGATAGSAALVNSLVNASGGFVAYKSLKPLLSIE